MILKIENEDLRKDLNEINSTIAFEHEKND